MSALLFPELETETHDPGGKVKLRIPAHWKAEAEFGGPRDCYRYKAVYRWGDGAIVLWLMCNPSVASEVCLDPTLAKCGEYARLWGYDGFAVANACAYRSTSPAGLLTVDDPVGPRNHEAILELAAGVAQIIIGHGKLPGKLQIHARRAVGLLLKAGYLLHALDFNADGSPRHPLFLRKTLTPKLWALAERHAA